MCQLERWALLGALLGLLAAVEPRAAAGEERPPTLTVLDLTKEKDVAEGDAFEAWMRQQGWTSLMGRPVFFSVRDGALQLVSKPGPVFRNRVWLAIRDRQKLRYGLENKVLLRLTGEKFRVGLDRLPVLRFTMAPVTLPGKGADLRDSSRNDAAFYLLVSFDTPRHDYEGLEIPLTVAYVWANRPWRKPVGKDPDYAEFMRYIPIGHGGAQLGTPREIRRDVKADFRLAFPEHKGAANGGRSRVPDVVQVGLLIDSNTVNSVAASRLHWIRFEAE